MERYRNWSFERHGNMCYGMIETQNISMQTETSYRIIAVSILGVPTNRVPHIGRMHTDLVLTACFQLIFY